KKILPRFDNARDWSDLMTIMKNFKENLKKYSTFNMAKISDKVLLGKRLAQCLNPSLPHGLHEITLEVYDMLFDNIRVNFSHKHSKTKQTLLAQISEYTVQDYSLSSNMRVQGTKQLT